MKKKKILLLIIILILVTIVVGIIIYLEKLQSKNNAIRLELDEGIIEIDPKAEIVRLDSNNTYYSVEKMFENYYLYLKVQNNKALINLLDEDYKVRSNIGLDNTIDKILSGRQVDNEYKAKEIYIKQHDIYPVYFVKMQDKLDINNNDYYILHTDNKTSAFSIEPITQEEYNLYTQNSKDYTIKENTINKNSYNKIIRTALTEEERVKKYFEDYLLNALYNVEEAYNSLDSEYCEKKFSNIDEYKQYIDRKTKQLVSIDYNGIKTIEDLSTEYGKNSHIMGISGYNVTNKDGYTQYIAIDDYGNYYIFKVTAPMQYTVILDTYTIDLPEFVEKYNSGTDEQKVALNIDKFIQAINDKDYKYAYSCLYQEFKDNNYPTLDSFANYIDSNLFNAMKLQLKNYINEGKVNIYNITLSSLNESESSQIDMQIIMQLKGERDFTMSFSIE